MTHALMNHETSFMVIGMFADAGAVENTNSNEGNSPLMSNSDYAM